MSANYNIIVISWSIPIDVLFLVMYHISLIHILVIFLLLCCTLWVASCLESKCYCLSLKSIDSFFWKVFNLLENQIYAIKAFWRFVRMDLKDTWELVYPYSLFVIFYEVLTECLGHLVKSSHSKLWELQSFPTLCNLQKLC